MKRFLMTMVAVMLVVACFTGCLGEKSDEEMIRDTVTGFFECYNGGDFEGMMDHLSRQQRQIMEGAMSFVGELADFDISSIMPMMFGLSAEIIEGELIKFETERIEINGETAEVYGNMKLNASFGADNQQKELFVVIQLKKEGSDWKISLMNPRSEVA